MGNLTNALIIVLTINAVLFLGQYSINNINPDNPNVFNYNCKDNILGGFELNNCADDSYSMLNLNNNSISSQLPNNPTLLDNIGQFFTDIYTSIRNWILGTLGLSYVLAILSGPAVFLNLIGLPDAFVWVLSAIWYGITLFLIVNWFKGGNE